MRKWRVALAASLASTTLAVATLGCGADSAGSGASDSGVQSTSTTQPGGSVRAGPPTPKPTIRALAIAAQRVLRARDTKTVCRLLSRQGRAAISYSSPTGAKTPCPRALAQQLAAGEKAKLAVSRFAWGKARGGWGSAVMRDSRDQLYLQLVVRERGGWLLGDLPLDEPGDR